MLSNVCRISILFRLGRALLSNRFNFVFPLNSELSESANCFESGLLSFDEGFDSRNTYVTSFMTASGLYINVFLHVKIKVCYICA